MSHLQVYPLKLIWVLLFRGLRLYILIRMIGMDMLVCIRKVSGMTRLIGMIYPYKDLLRLQLNQENMFGSKVLVLAASLQQGQHY